MLKRISITNYALIEQLDINWDSHLNVITGETGAGKSIVIDALTLILGQRANKQNIRQGADRMSVQGVFSFDQNSAVHEHLAEMAIATPDDELILTRSISRSGHNVCRVNGYAVTVAQLKTLGRDLVDIHSQHENNSLFQSEAQRRLLDAWGGTPVAALLLKTRQQADKLKTLSKTIRDQEKDAREIERRKEMIAFELAQIREAHLDPAADAALEKEQRILENGEMLFSLAGEARSLLDGDDGESAGVLESLAQLQERLARLSAIDETFAPYRQTVKDALDGLGDLSGELGVYLSDMAFDPKRLETVEQRLALIEGLRRKYGATVEEIVAYGEQLAEELDDLAHHDDHLIAMKHEYKTLWKAYRETAAVLHAERLRAAETLSGAIEGELADLAMNRARFKIEIEKDEKIISPWGSDTITFQIAVNPGTPLRPLKEVASGGEISRIMLAIKCIFGELDCVETMIFDEIDTGISGRTAQTVAEKIMALSRKRQVICITHLPQIAAMADAHFEVLKSADEKSTQVAFHALSPAESRDALAGMLSGAAVTASAGTHAEEMLALARAQKEKQRQEAKI